MSTNINNVDNLPQITNDDKVFMSDGGTLLRKTDVTTMAKYVLETYTGSSIGGSARSAKSAIDSMSSSISSLNAVAATIPTDAHIRELVGTPLVASTVSGMTDQTKIYVYTGSETGYTAGHWYYYNGSAWTDGGTYNSAGVDTDKTLSVSDKAADGKAVGDALTSLNGDLSELQEPTRNICDAKLGRYYSNSTNGNVVSANNDTSYFGLSDYVDVVAGETYTISFGGTAEYYIIFVRNADDTKNERLVYNGTGPKTLTIKTGGSKLHVYFRNQTTPIPDSAWIQIEVGTTATDYIVPISTNDVVAREQCQALTEQMEDIADQIDTIEASIPKSMYKVTDKTVCCGMRTGSGALSVEDTVLYSVSEKAYKMQPGTNFTVNIENTNGLTINTVNVFYFNTDGTFNKYSSKTTFPFSVTMASDCGYVMLMSKINGATSEHVDTITIDADKPIEKVNYPNIISPGFGSLTFTYRIADGVRTSGRLLLPPNYTMDGKKVPLIVFVHGSGGMLQWGSTIGSFKDGVTTKTYLPYLQYLRDEGFAVFDCYPWGNKVALSNDTDSPFIIPLHIHAYLAGIRYVCEHFNVDINAVNLLCKSQGGHIGQWAVSQSLFPFKSVSLFAPSCGIGTIYSTNTSIFTNAYCRRALAEHGIFDFASNEEKETFISGGSNAESLRNSGFFDRNKAKLVGMLPTVQGMTNGELDNLFIYGTQAQSATPEWMSQEVASLQNPQFTMAAMYQVGLTKTYVKSSTCPSKFWAAYDDDSVPARSVYACYRWLANGGADTAFRELAVGTGGHHAMDTDTNAAKSSGTTALGITYTDIPTAYVEVVQFIRSKMGD